MVCAPLDVLHLRWTCSSLGARCPELKLEERLDAEGEDAEACVCISDLQRVWVCTPELCDLLNDSFDADDVYMHF